MPAASPDDVRPPYDVIVVLGAAVRPNGQASPALRRRVLHAVALLQRGDATALLLTGGVGAYPPAEAQVMQQLALEQGIAPQRIVLEVQATSTLESALQCRPLLRQHGWQQVLLVTDQYHLRRSILSFRACGIRVTGSAVPGQPARRVWRRWYQYGRESCALVWYTFRLLPIVWQRHQEDRAYAALDQQAGRGRPGPAGGGATSAH
ncbi:MAG: YdcF family protein [Candidatus Tectimicrobiota bacterium]